MDPSTKLMIKSSICLFIILVICAFIPDISFLILIIVGSLIAWSNSVFFYKEKIDYKNYLSSPEWKAKKLSILKRDDYKCRSCGSNILLHVHHITYKRIGKERLSDLVTVCANCHKELHDYHGKNAKYYPLIKELVC